jgi:hypothetical protein
MRSRTIVGAVLAGICAVVALPGLANAGDKADVNVSVEFQPSAGQPAPHHYVGKVKSDKGKCINKRTVKLIGPASNPSLVTKSKSDEDGNYQLAQGTPAPGGEYKIKVPESDDCKVATKTVFGGG